MDQGRQNFRAFQIEQVNHQPRGHVVVRRAPVFLLDGLTISAAEALQKERDRRTAVLFQRLKNGDGPRQPDKRIIVYLRPFDVNGRMKWDEGFLEEADGNARQDQLDRETKKWERTTLPLVNFNIGIRENASLFEQNSEFETHLEQAVRRAGHFIALGRPGEALGAGRLPTDEAEWQESVSLLIKAATLCIVIPGDRPGMLWEIRHIVQTGYLEKSCILMPAAFGECSYAYEWEAARMALADVLPRGCCFAAVSRRRS
ncbi:hypothetical protein [Rhizobium leguminosarum]